MSIREGNIACWALDMGADGHVFDAESEYEGHAQQATQMLSQVRRHTPNAFLAYAPFPIISYHPNLPFIEFGAQCDAVMPSTYWEDFRAIEISITLRPQSQIWV